MEKNHTPPLNYDPSDPDKMRLPASTTCGDCVQKCLPNGIRYMLPPLVLSGYQLREALTFIAPDGTDDQMEQEVCIAERDAGIDMDGEKYESGLCCWMEEYPEEGSIALTGNSALYTPPAAEAQGVPSVDEIAQFIRAADGAHQMGAGALAERLHAWLAPQPANPASAPVSKRADQWARLYTTANALVARIGEKGEIDSRANETESLMDALHDLDGGQWVPGLTPAIAQVSGSTAQPKGIVTEFNVGRYVMNEDDCRAEGLDFRAYERGVADAAAAFARNMGTAQGAEPPPNLSEYDLGQWWVKEIERRRAEKEAAPTQYGWLSMESVASHIAEQVVSKIAALTPQAVQGAEPSDIAAVRHTLMTGLAHNAAIAALNRIAPAGLGKVVPA